MKLSLLALIVLARSALGELQRKNMNEGGVPYAISNPPGSTPGWKGTPGTYSTAFTENVEGKVDFFDVYGEVRTKYSEVYWTRNLPIDLPPKLVQRFKNKVMAITGYEVDQVTHKGPQPGSTTTKEQLGGNFKVLQGAASTQDSGSRRTITRGAVLDRSDFSNQNLAGVSFQV